MSTASPDYQSDRTGTRSADSSSAPILIACDSSSRPSLAAAAVVVVARRRPRAQIYEAVGTRAQGMGGAFVAVADDATATWWNPGGPRHWARIFSVVVETWPTTAARPSPRPAARRGAATPRRSPSSFPALGLSYYRLRISEIAPAVALQGPGAGPTRSRGDRCRSAHRGVEPVRRHRRPVARRSPGRRVDAEAGARRRWRWRSALPDAAICSTHADDLDVSIETAGRPRSRRDGVVSGSMRLGVSVKHVSEPEFGEGDDAARAGAAGAGGRGGDAARGTSVDADGRRRRRPDDDDTVLRRRAPRRGGRRSLAVAAAVGVRGGVSANTVGDGAARREHRASASRRGAAFYVDGALTLGSDALRDGWRSRRSE